MSDASGDRDAARARLLLVRERFAARLAARVDELLERIASARSSAGDLAEPITLAHRLAGTAGSYGYDDAGVQAAGVEELLRRIDGGDEVWEELDTAVQRLREASPRAAG